MRSAAAPIFFRAQVYGICWCAMWAHRAAAASRRMEKLSSCADGPRWPLLYAQLPPFHCGCASTPQRSLFFSLPSSFDAEKGQGLLRCLLQLAVASKPRVVVRSRRAWRMPLTSPLVRAGVDACVASSDAVKGSHIQRSPLSMGAQSEPVERDLQK